MSDFLVFSRRDVRGRVARGEGRDHLSPVASGEDRDHVSRVARGEGRDRVRSTGLALILVLAVLLAGGMCTALLPSTLAGPSPAWAAPLPGDTEESPFEAPEIEDDAVTAELLAESGAVAPGQALVLGVHLHMKPGWHTYWQNGGDAGLPTTVTWDLPKGFEAGPLQWPTPHRYVEAGDIVTYGYQDNVVLLSTVKVPADLKDGGRVVLKAEVGWLQCKALCVPGDAKVQLTLPVVAEAKGAGTDPRIAALFESARALLPRPASSYEGLRLHSYLSLNALPPGQSAHAAFVIEGLPPTGKIDAVWFPEAHPPLSVREASIESSGGRLRALVPFELEDTAEPNARLSLRGVLKLKSKTQHWYLQLSEPVPVAAEGQAIEATHDEIFGSLLVVGEGAASGLGGGTSSTVSGSAAPAGQAPVAEGFAKTGSIWRYLLLALIGGIILNIMPCVLPVLSLKVLGFVSHADRDRATVFRLSLMFALGVLASFLALAVVVIVLQRAGALLGWGFQFQNPTFVVVMITIVFVFGLNLFGLFEIVPSVGSLGRGTKSLYAEQFFNGVLATILATPCSAPFLGTALGFAFTQPPWVILAIFMTIGVGLALPYVLLSINPAWLRFVPKPGPWMERFKQFMGFLLMATTVWLLWVVGQQLGGDGVIHVLWFILVLALVVWIHGAFLSLSSSRTRHIVVWVVSLALVIGGWSYFLGDVLSEEGLARAAQQRQGKVIEAGELEWVRYSPELLEKTVRGGKTVFLDCTAAWCLTCKANEKAVIDTKEVKDKLKQLGVVTMMGDWTQRDPQISKLLRKYGRSGVPFYAVFPAGKPDSPIVLPEVIDKSMVIQALEKAGKSR